MSPGRSAVDAPDVESCSGEMDGVVLSRDGGCSGESGSVEEPKGSGAGSEAAASDCPGHPGLLDGASVEEALAELPKVPGWDCLDRGSSPGRRLRGAERILRWLETTDRETGTGTPGLRRGDPAGASASPSWQRRWLSVGGDADVNWWAPLVEADERSREISTAELSAGLCWLFVAGVFRPGYSLFVTSKHYRILAVGREVLSPDALARVAAVAETEKVSSSELSRASVSLVKIMLHVGRPLEQLRAEDLIEYHRWGLQDAGRRGGTHRAARQGRPRGSSSKGAHTAWHLLTAIGVLNGEPTLLATSRVGQRSITDLVDDYRIASGEVRAVLIRYLNERAPALDYNTLRALVGHLAGRFWSDIERHHPGIDSLHLPHEVVTAWKQRLQLVGTGEPNAARRKTWFDVLLRVRAFYLDIAEWAMTDPSWAPWAVPSPVKRRDTEGFIKARNEITAQMHQRIRDRLPHLSTLLDAARTHLDTQRDLLDAATAAPSGQVFTHAGRSYRRHAHIRRPGEAEIGGVAVRSVIVHELTGPDDAGPGRRIDQTRVEDEAFWSWAGVETLRHTGVRLEELLEITHLALVSYRLPDTGEVVPLLQIVPSKSGQERLLLVSPELAAVLAAIISRLRADNDGTVALVSRYDPHERTGGPPLPHLFQRRTGHRRSVINYSMFRRLLNDTVARTGLRDAVGEPLNYTAHDFRRMFATEAVTGGLPVHIAARVLGHQSITTTQTYVGIFQDDLVRAYRSFLDHRRAARPSGEYREPTDAEWEEFQQHFELRKLELGTCGRPYGSPCQHEHACVRCPMLRVDPAQRQRLVEIIANLRDRIAEADANGWRGEVQGLQTSLDAAARKLVALDRSLTISKSTHRAELGIPHPPARKEP